MNRLPNFFIVGAPKAGTTSLHHYLDQHPQIYMSSVKEPNFFAAEVREENMVPEIRRDFARDARKLREFLSGPMHRKRFGGIVADWDDYLRLFANAGEESALGEASACYLWSSTASARIAERVPRAKIVVMLRNPSERAFSQYLQGVGNGSIRWSFREHIRRNLSHRSEQMCIHYPFLEFGFYSEQVRRYLDRFGPNVWVGFYENFKGCAPDAVRSICRFLGVAPEFSPDMTHRHLDAQVPRVAAIAWLKRAGFWQAAASLTPPALRPRIRRALVRKAGETPMDPKDRSYLHDFYREDVGRLATLLGQDLESWQR